MAFVNDGQSLLSPRLMLVASVLLLIALILGLSACQSGAPLSRQQDSGDAFSRQKDGGPSHDVDVSQLADAIPRVDPITIAGNKNPYTINGKTYHLLPSAKGYSEVGMASWYGTKFHGRKTSNGEVYSMYGMTSAHKTLPIPAYVRVTNMANGRQVIVRVNDRGPFHNDRIIDLSYAAAKKLGYANVGTGKVKVEAIDPANYQPNSVAAPTISAQLEDGLLPVASLASSPATASPVSVSKVIEQPFLQVGVYSSMTSAKNLQQQLSAITSYPILVRRFGKVETPVFKVWIGPIGDQLQLAALRDLLIQQGRDRPVVVNATRDI